MGEMRGGQTLERSLGRPNRRWEDNITKDCQKVGWGDGFD